MFIIQRVNDETKQTIGATWLLKTSVSHDSEEEVNSRVSKQLRFAVTTRHVMDMKCKYIRGSLCVRLMTSSNRINVSLLCRGNVRVEGER